MFSILIAAGLAATPAGPIFDRTRPLVSDFDVSGTEISVQVTRGPGYYDYVYTFVAPPENRGKGQHFLVDMSCAKPVTNAALGGHFPESMARNFLTNDNIPYMPAHVRWGEGESAEVTVYPRGMAHLFVTLEPGTTDTVHIRSPGAPVPRAYSLRPNVEYYERIDWPADGHIENLPGETDFSVDGVVAAPGCSTQAGANELPHLAGTDVMEEFPGIDGLLSYSAPLRNRLHLAAGEETVAMQVHYGIQLDPASFETCPAALRARFNPVPGATETVHLPVSEARAFVTLAAQRKGPPPVQPQHTQATRSPIDVDVFEFRRNDLPYTPRTIDCRLYTTVPKMLAVYPPPPPPEYDGRPLLEFPWIPDGPFVAIPGQTRHFPFILSRQADPASLRVFIDDEDVTNTVTVNGPMGDIPLPAKRGERRIVVQVNAFSNVVGAPQGPQRIEHRMLFKGLEAQISARAIRVGPDGRRTSQEVRLPSVEIAPETGAPLEKQPTAAVKDRY